MRRTQDQDAADGPQGAQAIPRPVLRFAHLCLAVSAAIFAMHVLFAIHLRLGRAVMVGAAVLFLGTCASFWLSRARRVKVGLLLVSILVGVYGVELALDLHFPGAATAAASAGRAWDSRRRLEVIEDLRAQGADAWPCILPSLVLQKAPQGLPLAVGSAIPLGGISDVVTVHGNESGSWMTYESDEHGFNNPKGIWSAETEIALVGDSFTQGMAVPPDRNIAGVLRRRFPTTLNLGIAGNGPLVELATMVEYLSVKKPKRVVWLYCHNDMSDLSVEAKIPALRRYLDDEGFRAGLVDQQPAIDEILRRVSTSWQLEPESLRWPRRLSALGLRHRRAPVWLQDLATRQQNSSLSSLLRLQRLLVLSGWPWAPSAPPDYALFESILRRADRMTTSWGGKLYFVYLPDFARAEPHRAGVLDAARAAGLPIIDMNPVFEARSDVDRLRWYRGSHLDDAGYELAAQTIMSELTKREQDKE